MKTYNVYVTINGVSRYVGDVAEKSASLARLAALSKYGVSGERLGSIQRFIYADDDFDVAENFA